MKKFLFLIALFTLMGGANSVKAEDVKIPIELTGGNGGVTVKAINPSTLEELAVNPEHIYAAKFTTSGDFQNVFQYKPMVIPDDVKAAGCDRIIIEFGDDVNDVWKFHAYGGQGDFVGIGGETSHTLMLDGDKNIDDFTIFNFGGGVKTIIVKAAYFYKSGDPLADEKAALESAINLGGKYSPFAKTTASFATLTGAISDGETEYSNPSATVESLTAATTAINDAIAGLKLEPGYTNLTKGMANKDVDYVLFSSTGLAYGTGGVDMNTYAELNEFDQFIVLASAGKPRFCMNRKTADGQIGADLASSNMIDINTQGDYAGYTWATDKYQTIDGNKYTVDLNLIAADWNGLAKLHCIKGANYGNVTVTDMLLYRTINVGATGYATFGSLYKNAKPNGVTAYAAKYEDGQVTLNPVTNVPAGKGVVIEAAEGSYAPTFDVEADDIDSDLKVSNGTVVGDGSTIYVLNKVADKVGFYLLKAGNTLEAGKAYLKIEDGVAKARAFVGIRGMDVTGISTVKQAEGKKDDVIYNLNGQRVSNPTKGVFIKNGVKFLVD